MAESGRLAWPPAGTIASRRRASVDDRRLVAALLARLVADDVELVPIL
jgi:hypothetical protein